VPLAHGAHADIAAAAAWILTALVVLVPSAAYLVAARARRASGRGWGGWRVAGFIGGLAMAAAAVSPALQSAGHENPRVEVLEHLLLGMFAPLGLVLAAPVTLLLSSLPVAHRSAASAVLRSRLLHRLAHPAAAAVLDMGGLYLLHLTPLHSLATTNAFVHHLVNLHFLVAGCLFTWSIAGPDPAPRRPGVAVRAAVLIAAGAAHAHLAKLLYARAAQLPPGGGPSGDAMQDAAQLMYYGGDLAELALAVALFATWYRLRRPRTSTRPGSAQPAAFSRPPPSPSTRGARSG
jgi:putative membrane protein